MKIIFPPLEYMSLTHQILPKCKKSLLRLAQEKKTLKNKESSMAPLVGGLVFVLILMLKGMRIGSGLQLIKLKPCMNVFGPERILTIISLQPFVKMILPFPNQWKRERPIYSHSGNSLRPVRAFGPERIYNPYWKYKQKGKCNLTKGFAHPSGFTETPLDSMPEIALDMPLRKEKHLLFRKYYSDINIGYSGFSRNNLVNSNDPKYECNPFNHPDQELGLYMGWDFGRGPKIRSASNMNVKLSGVVSSKGRRMGTHIIDVNQLGFRIR